MSSQPIYLMLPFVILRNVPLTLRFFSLDKCYNPLASYTQPAGRRRGLIQEHHALRDH